MSDSTERNCNKCIHHTSGMCDSWDCKMQTVEDVKKEAVNEYVKMVVEELELHRFECKCGNIIKVRHDIGIMDNKYAPNYCDNCGKKLDWSDEE